MLAALVPEGVANAGALSKDDLAKLAAGEMVKVPLDVDLPQGGYFGGISYGVIPAPHTEVMSVLRDPRNYTSILPWTMEARLLRESQRDMQVFFRQGARSANATYVMIIRRESQGLIRFWLDPTKDHDIADVWGYFRVQPWGKDASLLTYAALLRLDFGVVKFLFSEKIREAALDTPGIVRNFVVAHRAKPAPG